MAVSVYGIWQEWWELIIRGAIMVLATIPFILSGDALSKSSLKYKDIVSRLAILFGLVIAFVTAFYLPREWLLDLKNGLESNVITIVIVLFIIFIIGAVIHKKK